MKLEHSPQFLVHAKALEPLLRQRKYYQAWSQDKLFAFLAWYWNRGLISFSIDALGQGHAVCLIRLFRRLEQMFDYSAHDPCGEFCFIELLVSDTPNGIADCFQQLFASFGPQKVMIWDRAERTERKTPRMYTWEQYLLLTSRLTYGLIESVKKEKC